MGWVVLDERYADETTETITQAECPLCHKPCGYGNKLYHEENGWAHAVCVWEAAEKKKTEPFEETLQYVSVYEVARYYGGPEEGGWWYNNYRLIESYPAKTGRAVDGLVQTMERKYAAHQPEYNIYSAANDGPEYKVVVEDERGENEYLEKPHYE